MRQAGQRPGCTERAWRALLAMGFGLALGLGAAGAGHAAVPGAAITEPDLATQAMRFEEPLVPAAATSPEEDAALAAAIARYRHATAVDDFSALEAFVASHPASGWRLAVLTNLGLQYYHFGYFSKATAAFEQAWTAGKDATEAHAKALADRAAGELLRMHARLGHSERLATLLDEMAGRGLSGRASEWRDGAKEGLWTMRHKPGVAYLCGPMALKNLLLAGGDTPAQVSFLDNYQSSTHGVTLAEVGRLAGEAKLPYHLIHRVPGDPIPVPAIIHWKVNHFAAIIGARDGRYELTDPTFGQPHMWVTRAAIDAEASGYFLVPGAQQSPVWQDVSADEAKRVYGMGQTGTNDPSATTPDDADCDCGGDSGGMTRYAFTEMLVSLRLTDTPVGYAPPKGPPVRIQLSYNQREAGQPANFSYFNVSPKWTLNVLSYIQDDPTTPGTNVERVVAGGGYVNYSAYNAATRSFAPEINDGSVLSFPAAGSPAYVRTKSDGSAEIYSASNGATSYPRLIFLSQIVDPSGNALSLGYDNKMRLTTITDATGRVTKFAYANASSPLLVTQITDPFGRSAKLAYDSSGRLSQITDVLGLTSKFTYDGSSLVDALTTPYGTTNFSYGDNGNSRYLQATDPLGNTERVEYVQGAPGIPFSDPANTVPQGIVAPFNQYMNDRDTFYWDKHAYAIGHGDYTKARNRHWVHLATNTNVTGNTLESIHTPLENRIWFNYPGQPNGGLGTAQTGTLNKPSNIGRVLDDGSTQLTQFQYNALGNPTTVVDPVGRTTTLQYAPNQVDIVRIQQTTGTGPATIATFTYNAQHLPLTATNAAGQTTSYTYNAAGQIKTVTDPLGHVTTYNYDPLGYRVSIVNATGHPTARFTYDALGRVATRTDSEGWTVAFAHDAMDRLTQETYPDGTTRAYAYNKLDLKSVKDRQNRVTTYAYDTTRKLISIKDPLGRLTKLGYYENGVPKSLTDPNGHATTWAIDLQSRVVGKAYADGRQFTNTYEATTSRLHALTDPLGQIKQYTYLADDRVAAVQYLHAVNPTPSVGFSYDPSFPRVAAMTDGTGTTTYSYSPVGSPGALQLAQEAPPFANSAIAYSYDNLGRVIGLSVGGDVETATYDALGRINTHADDLGTFQRTFMGQTWQLKGQLSGLVGTQWTHDTNLNDRRVTAVINRPAASHFALATTPEADITSVAESRYQQTWSYTYDLAQQLKTATSSLGPAYQYGYDGAGNLSSIQTPHGTTTVASNGANQVTTAGAATFTYDANGNLLSDYARTYQWDAENRLIGIGYPGTPGAYSVFRYDGLGRRISIVTGSGGTSGEIRYGWCGNTLCEARAANDAITRRYFAEGEANFIDGSLLYYGVDHLGSVRDVIVAQNGLKAAHFDYDPYGNPTQSVGSRQNWTDFRYAGLFYHQQSGLYLATRRAYDPVVGRWLSRDPLGEAGGANLYAYVAGSPVIAIDIDGLSGTLTVYSSGTSGLGNHSWISYTPDGGTTTTYGTWGNNPTGAGNGLFTNLEQGRGADATRSSHLDDSQEASLMNEINQYRNEGQDAWTYGAPCSTFAADSWNTATGESLSPYWGPISNPTSLTQSITAANGGAPNGTLTTAPTSSGTSGGTSSNGASSSSANSSTTPLGNSAHSSGSF